MKLFSYLYDKTLVWSSHRQAPYFLAGVSFAESSFFPIPPDVMLISMGLATPTKSWQYACITTLFSVIGGIFGYFIGALLFESMHHWIAHTSYAKDLALVLHWFDVYGVWIIIVAGFAPIPYKFFTIAAGVAHMPFLPFVISSTIGRGARFFLVSGLLYFFGNSIRNRLRLWVDVAGLVVVCILVGYILFRVFGT